MAEKKAKKSAGGEDARQANLDSALAQITKTFGEGSIMRLGDVMRGPASRAFPPDLFRSIWPSALAGCPKDASLKSTDRNPPAKPR